VTHAALAALRDGTEDVHRRLEVDLPLVRADLSTEGYHSILGRFWGIIAPLEEALDGAGVPLDDWAERRKAPLLVADLPDVTALPRCHDLPALGGHDAVLGCLYVLEGSTLGGRHVAAHVEATLGPVVGTREAIARRADAGGDIDVMVSSAHETFERFHDWLTG
jgi:heme oxygenase